MFELGQARQPNPDSSLNSIDVLIVTSHLGSEDTRTVLSSNLPVPEATDE